MNDDWLDRLVPKHPLWFVWAGGSILSAWIFFWWSLGLLPSPAFGGGFARAEESQFNTQMALEDRLLDIRIRQCLTKDGEAKVFYTAELTRLKNLYLEKLDVRYDEPACSEVIVVPASS